MTFDLALVFDQLPFPAWLAGVETPRKLRCNQQAAKLSPGASNSVIAVAELQTQIALEIDGEQAFDRRIMDLLESAGEDHFRGRLMQAPHTRFRLAAQTVADAATGNAVLLIAIPQTAPASLLPSDWWRHVRHDLRDPISPICMASQLLKSPRTKPEDIRESLLTIERQLDVLLGASDDLSDLLAVQADCFGLRSVPADLCQIIDTLAAAGSLLKGLAEEGISLRCHMPDTAIVIQADAPRLLQLLDYLVRRIARKAAAGTTIHLQLAMHIDHATLNIGGPGSNLADDAELAHVAGFGLDARAIDLGMKPLLVREIARRHDITFNPLAAGSGIFMRMPLASKSHHAT